MKHIKTLVALLASSLTAGVVTAQYCTTSWSSGCTYNDQIENFYTTGGITNISNLNSGCATGYSAYYPNQVVTVFSGQSFGIAVQANSAYQQGFGIWVDWNDDGDFTDAGEFVWNSGTYGNQYFYGTITPPSFASGYLRMRVKCTYVSVPTTPCGSATFGEEEDYLVRVLTTIKNYPYCEDFEDNNGAWNSSGVLPSWEHGVPNNNYISSAYSGTKAWVTDLNGNYSNDELSYLTTPEFDFSNLNDPVITFYTKFALESGDDGVQLQVSQDSGNTFTVLGSTSSSNWYNSNSIAALVSTGNGNGWTDSTDWVQMSYDLSSYAGDTSLMFRFVMAADGNATAEGIAIDKVMVSESNDVAAIELIHPDSACGNSITPIQLALCNLSVVPKTGFDIDWDTNGTGGTYTYNDTLPLCGCDTVTLTSFNTTAGGFWNIGISIDNFGDVNASNDTLSSTMLMYATPGVSLTGGGDYCQGDTAQLHFTFTGIPPFNLSYTNGSSGSYIPGINTTTYTLNVFQSGNYEPLYITDASGCPADTSTVSGFADVNFVPAPVVDLGPDTTVCSDYELDAGSGHTSYTWSTGATTQKITAESSGTYSVTVTNSIGCPGSDQVTLTVNPVPVVNLKDTVLCEGSTYIFNPGGGYASYLWHDGSTGSVYQVNSVTTVSVTVTDFNGCSGSGSASITAVVDNPKPKITSSEGYAPVTLDAGSGYIAYFWNTGATTQTIQVAVPGTYSCTVTDKNGCKGSDDAKAKIWPTGVEDIVQEHGLAIYPNPVVSGLLTITWNESRIAPEAFQVTDVAGRVLLRDKVSGVKNTLQIDLGDLPPGQYGLTITGKDAERFTKTFIIAN
ncbi:MAG: hypothetical protein Kow0075_14490 [Salibacteraceae bacterium]